MIEPDVDETTELIPPKDLKILIVSPTCLLVKIMVAELKLILSASVIVMSVSAMFLSEPFSV